LVSDPDHGRTSQGSSEEEEETMVVGKIEINKGRVMTFRIDEDATPEEALFDFNDQKVGAAGPVLTPQLIGLTTVRSKEGFSSRPEEYRGFASELLESNDDSDHIVYEQNWDRTPQDNQSRMKTRRGISEYYQQEVENKLKRKQQKQEDLQRFHEFQRTNRLQPMKEQGPQDGRKYEQAGQQARQKTLQEQELIQIQGDPATWRGDFLQTEMSEADVVHAMRPLQTRRTVPLALTKW